MKEILYILIFLTTCIVHSQTAFKNHSGSTFQLHPGAEVGFHTDLVNEGIIKDTKNAGSAGFYSDNEVLTVSGTNIPEFHNFNVATTGSFLDLKISLGVTNELWFVGGKVNTQRDELEITSLDLIGHQFYEGANNDRHIDGYNSVVGYNNEYTFPIGDDERLRPMILADAKNSYKGAYFFEDANVTSYFGTSFDTTIKANDIDKISVVEYWALLGDTPTEITLTWDMFSEVNVLVDDVKDLTVVGWNKAQQKWIDLGRSEVSGDIAMNGKVKSLAFVPDDYTVITLGSSENSLDNFCDTGVNTFTPDGNGVNDVFKLPCADKYPPGSTYLIFDRLGSLVYTPDNILDTWAGGTNVALTVEKEKNVPTGVYFYLAAFKDDNGKEEVQKGWIYLVR